MKHLFIRYERTVRIGPVDDRPVISMLMVRWRSAIWASTEGTAMLNLNDVAVPTSTSVSARPVPVIYWCVPGTPSITGEA